MSREIVTTIGDLVAAEQALARVSALQLPVKQAYGAAKLLRLVKQELATFNEVRDKKLRELGTPTDHPDTFNLTPDAQVQFRTQLEKLAAETVTLPYGPLDISTWGDVKVAPADLVALGPLLADTEP